MATTEGIYLINQNLVNKLFSNSCKNSVLKIPIKWPRARQSNILINNHLFTPEDHSTRSTKRIG